MKSLTAATLLFMILFIESASGYDNHRRGFVFGAGVGIGIQDEERIFVEDATDLGIQSDINIGHGFSDQLIIHYSGKQFWSLGRTRFTFFTQGNPHVTLTYFFKPSAPSFFVGGAIGPGVIFVVGDDYGGPAGKVSVHTTIGREIR